MCLMCDIFNKLITTRLFSFWSSSSVLKFHRKQCWCTDLDFIWVKKKKIVPLVAACVPKYLCTFFSLTDLSKCLQNFTPITIKCSYQIVTNDVSRPLTTLNFGVIQNFGEPNTFLYSDYFGMLDWHQWNITSKAGTVLRNKHRLYCYGNLFYLYKLHNHLLQFWVA